MRALALDAVGGLDASRRPRAAASPARASRPTCGCGSMPRRSTGSTCSLPTACRACSYSFPHIVGSDGAGVVEAVGPAGLAGPAGRPGHDQPRALLRPLRRRAPEGEESLCATFRVVGEHRPGTAAEYVVVPADNLAPVPAKMPWAEAAAFSLATLTAWRMLTTRAAARAQARPCSSGVSAAASRSRRSRSSGTSARGRSSPAASEAKLEVARRLGRGRDDQPRHGRRGRRGPPAHRGPRRGRRRSTASARRAGRTRSARSGAADAW